MIQSIKTAAISALGLLKFTTGMFVILLVYITVMFTIHLNVPITDWFNPYSLSVETIDTNNTVYLKYGRLIKQAFVGEYHVRVYDNISGFPVCYLNKEIEYIPKTKTEQSTALITLNQFVGSDGCNAQLQHGGKYTLSVYWTIKRPGFYPTVEVRIRDVPINMP